MTVGKVITHSWLAPPTLQMTAVKDPEDQTDVFHEADLNEPAELVYNREKY